MASSASDASAVSRLPQAESQPHSARSLTFVIEHMEPEISDWTLMEYRDMRQVVGAENLVFTLLDTALLASLPEPLAAPVRCTAGDVLSLGFPMERVCLLDPRAEIMLEPADAGKFDVVLFGGILGADPPLDRTAELRKKGFPNRNLGSKQMTTSTAVDVCRRILVEGTPYDTLRFIDWPEFKIGKRETTEMPFRYLADEKTGEPIVPDGFIEILKKDSSIF